MCFSFRAKVSAESKPSCREFSNWATAEKDKTYSEEQKCKLTHKAAAVRPTIHLPHPLTNPLRTACVRSEVEVAANAATAAR